MIADDEIHHQLPLTVIDCHFSVDFLMIIFLIMFIRFIHIILFARSFVLRNPTQSIFGNFLERSQRTC